MQVLTEAAGFATIGIGTFLLHATKDLDVSSAQASRQACHTQSSLADTQKQAHAGSMMHSTWHPPHCPD